MTLRETHFLAFGEGKFGEEKGRRKKRRRRRKKKEEEKEKKSKVWNTIMEILLEHLLCDVWNLYVRKYLSNWVRKTLTLQYMCILVGIS